MLALIFRQFAYLKKTQNKFFSNSKVIGAMLLSGFLVFLRRVMTVESDAEYEFGC